jgi:cytochrome c oxidase cbb3-type subunit 4
MDNALIQSVWTVVVLVLFVGIVIWAWSSKRKKDFDEAANIPFHEDEKPTVKKPTVKTSKENTHG